MTEQLSSLPNIGKKLEELLMAHGIQTPDELRSIGAVEACRRMSLSGEACLNKLYALEGAIQDIRWHQLTKEHKKKIKNEFLKR